MNNELFGGLFDSQWVSVISVKDFMICIIVSLMIGVVISLGYMFRAKYTESFVVTLALLPAIVCVVIMMVNGNVGMGVAVAGAFSLVRFRSMPGTAKEICAIFLAMSAGLIVGTGYLGFAVLYAVVMALAFVLYSMLGFGVNRHRAYKTIRITIPENLDYTGVFDDVFDEYVSSSELVSVKTTNMGSLFKLTYSVTLKDVSKEKELIDKLRCKNGNLEISISNTQTVCETL